MIVGFIAGKALGLEIYEYKDSQGTISYTNDLNEVPTAYKDKVIVKNTDNFDIKLTVAEQHKPVNVWKEVLTSFETDNGVNPEPDKWFITRERRLQGNHHNSVIVIYRNGVETFVIDM